MRYLIICTVQEPRWRDHEHAAISEVGTRTRRWTVEEVVAAMGEGHTFYTKGPRTGRRAKVLSVHCPPCDDDRIRSAPDATADSNLDALPFCSH